MFELSARTVVVLGPHFPHATTTTTRRLQALLLRRRAKNKYNSTIDTHPSFHHRVQHAFAMVRHRLFGDERRRVCHNHAKRTNFKAQEGVHVRFGIKPNAQHGGDPL